MIWTLLWQYKAWVLAAVIAIAAIAYISYIKIDHNIMKAKVIDQKSKIEVLEHNNRMLERNAVAVKAQDKKLQVIQQTSAKVQRMLAKLPDASMEVLKKDEAITIVNDCLVAYGNTGVLPDGCDAVKAYLPDAKPPAEAIGRPEPTR
jgi:hypothetical protein